MVCTYDESLVILRDFFVFVERTENKVCYLCLQSPNILDVIEPQKTHRINISTNCYKTNTPCALLACSVPGPTPMQINNTLYKVVTVSITLARGGKQHIYHRKNQKKKRTSVLLTFNLVFKSFLRGSRGAVLIFPTAVQGNEDLLDSSVIKLCSKYARFLHSQFSFLI